MGKAHLTRGKSAQQVRIAQDVDNVLRLRALKKTFDEIAAELGFYDRATAYRYYRRGMADLAARQTDSAEQIRQQILGDCDAQSAAIYDAATGSNNAAFSFDASKELREINAMRARLLGLNAPTKVEGTFNLGDLLSGAIAAAKKNEADGSSNEPEPV